MRRSDCFSVFRPREDTCFFDPSAWINVTVQNDAAIVISVRLASGGDVHIIPTLLVF